MRKLLHWVSLFLFLKVINDQSFKQTECLHKHLLKMLIFFNFQIIYVHKHLPNNVHLQKQLHTKLLAAIHHSISYKHRDGMENLENKFISAYKMCQKIKENCTAC